MMRGALDARARDSATVECWSSNPFNVGMKSDRFRAAAESKDFSAIDELFAEDVAFRSPVVFKPYEGRDAVAMLLGAVVQVFEDFRYTDQVETGDAAALAFSARVGDRELDGIDFLHFDSDGRVNRMAVYVRPMSGVNALAEAMQKKLEEASAA
jgi:SnoaL-like domain